MKFVNSQEGTRLHLRGIYTKIVQAGIVTVGDEVKKTYNNKPSIFCVCFMSELGQDFNKQVPIDADRIQHYESILDGLLEDRGD